MIRALVADDEVLARQKLRRMLKQIGDLEVVGECSSAHETIRLAKLTTPDLLFLDIRMPDMDGFDVLDALSSIPAAKRPLVIFVTANDRYAIRAFDIHAIDYLLKPYSAERLRLAVDRARDRQSAEGIESEIGNNVISHGTHQSKRRSQKATDRYASRLIFKSRGRILFLATNEIRWIEAEENYVRIWSSSESHLLRESIGHLEARLAPESFLRIHRSAIVNLEYVKEVKSEPDGDATVVLTSGEKIPMSRSYRARIQRLLKF